MMTSWTMLMEPENVDARKGQKMGIDAVRMARLTSMSEVRTMGGAYQGGS